MNHYQTLGLTKQATRREIKDAYYTLARTYHPDKNKEAGAEEKFKAIGEAYETLSNSLRRHRYDAELNSNLDSNETPPTTPEKPPTYDELKINPIQFFNILTTRNVPVRTRLEWTQNVIRLDTELFKQHGDRILTALPPKELLFLVQTGPTLSLHHEGTPPKSIQLAFCNPDLEEVKNATENRASPSQDAYLHLLHSILKPTWGGMRSYSTPFTRVEVAAIFMASMTFPKEKLHDYLTQMQLEHLALLHLRYKLYNLYSVIQNTVSRCTDHLSAQAMDDLQQHIHHNHTTLANLLFNLQIQADHQFVSRVFPHLPPENQVDFIRNFLERLHDEPESNSKKMHPLLKQLAETHAHVIVNLMCKQIQTNLTGTQNTKFSTPTPTMQDQIQWIQVLAAQTPTNQPQLKLFQTQSPEALNTIQLVEHCVQLLHVMFDSPRLATTSEATLTL